MEVLRLLFIRLGGNGGVVGIVMQSEVEKQTDGKGDEHDHGNPSQPDPIPNPDKDKTDDKDKADKVATPAQIRSAIDSNLATLYATVKAKQDAYFLANRRYFHLRRTHSAQPADGTTATCTRLSETSGEGVSWSSLGIAPGSISYCLEIFAYDAPAGHGWYGEVTVTINGKTWRRTRGEGPEAATFTKAWHEVKPLAG